MVGQVAASEPANIRVQALSYAFPNGKAGLEDVTLSLPEGSRTLLGGGWFLRPSHAI